MTGSFLTVAKYAKVPPPGQHPPGTPLCGMVFSQAYLADGSPPGPTSETHVEEGGVNDRPVEVLYQLGPSPEGPVVEHPHWVLIILVAADDAAILTVTSLLT